jgi:hypothetical protein
MRQSGGRVLNRVALRRACAKASAARAICSGVIFHPPQPIERALQDVGRSHLVDDFGPFAPRHVCLVHQNALHGRG